MRASVSIRLRAVGVAVLLFGAAGRAPAQPTGSEVPAPVPGQPIPQPLPEQLPVRGADVIVPQPGYVIVPQPGFGPPGAYTPPAPGFATAPPATPPAAVPAAEPEKPKFDINWNNGVFFQSVDKRFSFHAGATIQYDFTWYTASPLLQTARGGTGKFNDGVNLRRGRVFFEGTLYEAVDYKFELEFFNGFSPAGLTGPVSAGTVSNSPGPTDAWITIKDVPLLGNVRIGSQKEWFSLEHLNSYRNLEFLERSYLFDFSQATAFNNGFSPGISAFNTWLDDRVFTAVGAYKNESDLLGFGLNDGNYAVTGRVAALPVWMPDEQAFWHVGGAMSHRDPVNGQVQVRIRDNIRNAPFPLLPLVANTGLINAHSQDLFNLETAAVYGPVTLQAEYTANILRGANVAATATAPAGAPQGNVFFQGYYAEALVFLTGESRTWNQKNAFFNRVQPLRPLRLKPSDCDDGYGFGALELAARYSYVDLSNKGIQAGRLDSVTIGLNWYLNANAKMQFNYDYTHRGETNVPAVGHVTGFGIRSAFDF